VFVNYRPDGQPAQKFEFVPDKVMSDEAELIEKRFDQPWDQFLVAVMSGSMRARRILLWHLLRGEHPTISLDDVKFAIGEVQVEFDRTELQKMYDEAATSGAVPEAQREMVLAKLKSELDKAPAGAAPGKAPSNKRGKPTAL
jgi:hypothetical protein